MEELEEGGALNDMKESLLYPLIEVERKDEGMIIAYYENLKRKKKKTLF